MGVVRAIHLSALAVSDEQLWSLRQPTRSTAGVPLEQRVFKQGEVMPAFTTDYGATIWQWDEQQG